MKKQRKIALFTASVMAAGVLGSCEPFDPDKNVPVSVYGPAPVRNEEKYKTGEGTDPGADDINTDDEYIPEENIPEPIYGPPAFSPEENVPVDVYGPPAFEEEPEEGTDTAEADAE